MIVQTWSWLMVRQSPVARRVACLIIGWNVLSGCGEASRTSKPLEFISPHMGVQVRILLCSENCENAKAAATATAAFARIAALERCMSDYQADSELMRLCDRAGQGAIPVGDDLFDVLRRAQEISADSGGAFDVTIGPVTALWRRCKASGIAPSRDELMATHNLVNWRYLVLNEQDRTAELRLRGMRLDLGGIGKGYAGDCALAVLRAQGIPRCLIDLGGDLVVGDPPPGQHDWSVAVFTGLSGSPSRTLHVHNCAVATSGPAEQHLDFGGSEHSHIIDPLRSDNIGLIARTAVTVIAPDGATADALATALSVLEPEKAAGVIRRFSGASARIIQVRDSDKSVTIAGEFPPLR